MGCFFLLWSISYAGPPLPELIFLNQLSFLYYSQFLVSTGLLPICIEIHFHSPNLQLKCTFSHFLIYLLHNVSHENLKKEQLK